MTNLISKDVEREGHEREKWNYVLHTRGDEKKKLLQEIYSGYIYMTKKNIN